MWWCTAQFVDARPAPVVSYWLWWRHEWWNRTHNPRSSGLGDGNSCDGYDRGQRHGTIDRDDQGRGWKRADRAGGHMGEQQFGGSDGVSYGRGQLGGSRLRDDHRDERGEERVGSYYRSHFGVRGAE